MKNTTAETSLYDPFFNDVEQLTNRLIRIPSVNGTAGEREIGEQLSDYLRSLPYFKEHPGSVWTQPLPGDPLGRMNVFAYVKGGRCQDGKTILLLGHTDTVGIDDFGDLKSIAFDPIAVAEQFRKLTLSHDVKKDLESGDWLFGRGANDMKSGLAVHITVMERFSRYASGLSGNILFVASPVEENQHTGIMTALSELHRLKKQDFLEYLVALNNDFTSPLYEGDPGNYVYLGASGKLLPCFYIVGKETHVGHAYEGLDPNLIASALLRKIDLNAELADSYNGDYTMAPAALKLRDLKESYNVQTPISAFLYFNYYVNDISVSAVTELLKGKALEAFQEVIEHVDCQKKLHHDKTGLPYTPSSWQPYVITFSELCGMAEKSLGTPLRDDLSSFAKELKTQGLDARELCLQMVKKVHALWGDKRPCIVQFYSPPYCPHNTLKAEHPEEAKMAGLLRDLIDEINEKQGLQIKVKQFYPNLSDSSYIKIDDDLSAVEHLVENCPGWAETYNVPFEDIKALNIPAITLGCYGKDAHKMTERLYKPYSFETLPQMMVQLMEKMIG